MWRLSFLLLLLVAQAATAQSPAITPLAISAPVDLRFTSDEPRLFRLVPPETGALQVEVQPSPSGRNPPLWRWLDDTGRELRGYEADIAVAAGIPVVLEVRRDGWSDRAYAARGRARLRVTFRLRSSEDSAGLTLEAPRPLGIDQEARFTFFVRHEARYFRLVPPAAGALNADILTMPAGRKELGLRWLDETGKELRAGKAHIVAAAGAPVVLELRSALLADNDYTSPEPVKLRVGFHPRPANDSTGLTHDKPRPLAIDEVAELRLLVRDDARFFRLVAPATGAFEIESLWHSNDWGPSHKWLDEAGKRLRPNERLSDYSDIAVDAGMPVVVEVGYPSWRLDTIVMPAAVRLKVRFKPRSPDDPLGLSLDRPHPLAIGEAVRFTFFVYREHRFFRVVPPTDGKLDVEVLTAPRSSRSPVLGLTWWDDAGKKIAEEARARVAAGKPVILEVASSSVDYAQFTSPQPVMLRIRYSSR